MEIAQKKNKIDLSQRVKLARPLDVRRLEKIFNERFMPLYPQLYRMAAAILGNENDEAADAVQEVMVKIWRSGEKMASVQNPQGYAVAVLRSTAIDILRRRKTGISIEEAGNLPDTASTDFGTTDYLRRLIASCPKNQQKVLILSSFHNLSNEEIAGLTGFSATNVRQLLSRGRKKIRELYNKYI